MKQKYMFKSVNLVTRLVVSSKHALDVSVFNPYQRQGEMNGPVYCYIVLTACMYTYMYVHTRKTVIYIRKRCPCIEYPLKPHFYIVKLGYAGAYLFFLFLLKT